MDSIPYLVFGDSGGARMISHKAMRKLIQRHIAQDSKEVLWTYSRLMKMTKKEVDFKGKVGAR